jgi:hypothetical protein
MEVLSVPLGRLGNAVFRYLATVIFHIVYNATVMDYRSLKSIEKYIVVTDDTFIEWVEAHLNGHTFTLNEHHTYGFFGYFQHDTIYLKYRKQILEYMRTHPDNLVITDGKIVTRPDFDYVPEFYYAGDLVNTPKEFTKFYDTVVHLRLEDFIQNGSAIHPESIKNILDKIGADSYCVVVNFPNTELELQYIDYLKQRFNIHVESNDIITDFHIMKNAKTLICSCSTISWSAAFFSDTLQKLYMPNYPNIRPHETFRKPIDNTIVYDYRSCSKYELEHFLKNN